MTAEELANKFKLKVAAAVVEKDRQEVIAHDNEKKRTADMNRCRRAMETEVVPFLEEVKHHFGEDQFSFATQIERNDHRPVGVSFSVGNGSPTSITTAFGNIVVTRVGDSGTKKGVPFVYAPDAEPYISNSGDLTRDKIAELIEMVIDD
jgi:argininosuccinate synthase